MKKGSLFDMLWIVIFMFIVAISLIVGTLFYFKVNDAMQSAPGISDSGKTIMTRTHDRFVGWFDYLFLTVFVGVYLLSLVLASQIDVHPVFFPLSLVFFIVFVVLAAVIGNAFYDVASNETIAPYASEYTIIPFIMNNYVKIVLVMAFGLAWVMWGKSGQ